MKTYLFYPVYTLMVFQCIICAQKNVEPLNNFWLNMGIGGSSIGGAGMISINCQFGDKIIRQGEPLF